MTFAYSGSNPLSPTNEKQAIHGFRGSEFSGDDIVEGIRNIVSAKSIRGKNAQYSDIAILCRKNHMVDVVGEKCKAADEILDYLIDNSKLEKYYTQTNRYQANS